MVKYPAGTHTSAQQNESSKPLSSLKNISQNIYSHRGMDLEDEINASLFHYLYEDIAIIHKRPTPISVVKISYSNRKKTITEGYFSQQSTTDYNGVYKGKYLDFEAKEVMKRHSFELKNLHRHQIEHMIKVIKHGGIAFIIVFFADFNEVFLLDAAIIQPYYDDPKIKSVNISIFRKLGHRIDGSYTCPIDFLPIVDKVYFSQKTAEPTKTKKPFFRKKKKNQTPPSKSKSS
jgi:recombination protein U